VNLTRSRKADAAVGRGRTPGRRPTLTIVSLSTSCWGAEESLLLLAGHVDADVTIAAPAGELLERAAAAGLRTTTLTSPRILALTRIGTGIGPAGAVPAMLAAAAALVRAPIWSTDCVVSFSQWLHLSLALAGRKARVDVVLDLHDGPFASAGAKIQSAATWTAHRSVAVSRTALEHVGSWPRQRAVIVPRPVTVPSGVEAHTPREPGPLRMVIVGRLDPEKHVDLALAAHQRLLDRGGEASLEVVGAPKLAGQTLEELRARWPQATFCGRLGYAETLQHVAAADVLLSMAEGEAFGRTVLEAALVGVPAIAAGGGPAERIRDGENGYVVPLGQPQRLTGLMGELAKDPAALRRMGATARADATPLADPDRVAAEWIGACLGARA
jgi:glycosyltransferase involved in cell wall biosynthesis